MMNTRFDRILTLPLTEILGEGAAFRPELVSLVRDTLEDERRGAVVVRAEGQLSALHRILEVFLEVGRLLGQLLTETSSSEPFRIIHVRHPRKEGLTSPSYHINPYLRFPLHVDGTYLNALPGWFGLAKLADAGTGGGQTILLHRDDWADFDAFRADPRSRREVVWRLGRNEACVRAPFCRLEGENWRIRFLTPAMASVTGPTWEGPEEISRFADIVAASMAHSAGLARVTLELGDMLFVNNLCYLHGREPFVYSTHLFRTVARVQGVFAWQQSDGRADPRRGDPCVKFDDPAY